MDYVKYVNVFYGSEETTKPVTHTIADKWIFLKGMCGNTHPGATEPFGQMSVCAYSGGYPTGYGTNCPNACGKIRQFTSKKMMKGFSHCHQYGTGAMGIYYNYCIITPLYMDTPYGLAEILDEHAYPSYYCATLGSSGIQCEATVWNQVAHHRYHLEQPARIRVDCCNDGLDKSFGEAFYAEPELIHLSKVSSTLVAFTIRSFGVDKHFAVSVDHAADVEIDEENRLCFFHVHGNCEVKVALSLKSEQHAIAKIQGDQCDFSAAQRQAYQKWNKYLSRIEAEFASERDARLFYTLLYQSLIKPCDFSGESFLYEDAAFFVDIATMWDIYKTQLPLLFTLFKEESEKIVSCFIHCYQKLGMFPNSITINSNLTVENQQALYLMSHAIADAYWRGIQADYTQLDNIKLPALTEEAYPPHILDVCEDYAALKEIVHVQKPTVKIQDAFDCNTGLLKHAHYYEGDVFNYSFRLLNNMRARFELCSKEQYEAYLDAFFGFQQNLSVYDDPETVIDGKPAAKNMFEGFNNEPDMETPYNYNYLGKRDKLKEILDASYQLFDIDKNSAYPGNCDSGGLSACILWNMLGLFPLSGQKYMMVGFPKCKKATLHLSNGRILTLHTADHTLYIHHIPTTASQISLDELFSGDSEQATQGNATQLFK